MQFGMPRAGKAWRGYFPLKGELTSGIPDQKEGYYFGTELPASDPRSGVVPLHGPNIFPDNVVPELRSAVLNYTDAVAHLASQLLKGLAVGLLGPDHINYFHERFSSEPTCLFRVFRYPAHTFPADVDEWGVREHTGWEGGAFVGVLASDYFFLPPTDYGILTILKQDMCGGLQVKSWDGKWVEAPPVANSFVVNIGDMLELWTRGLYRATPHRVRNAANRDRYSYPCEL